MPNLLTTNLIDILKPHKDQLVLVVGTTCCGKKKFVEEIPDAQDMEPLLFSKLSHEQTKYVCQTPWTVEIGHTVSKVARENITIQPGKPMFGNVVLDADILIHLKIGDYLLQKRCVERGINYWDAKNLEKFIEQEILLSTIPRIIFDIEGVD